MGIQEGRAIGMTPLRDLRQDPRLCTLFSVHLPYRNKARCHGFGPGQTSFTPTALRVGLGAATGQAQFLLGILAVQYGNEQCCAVWF